MIDVCQFNEIDFNYLCCCWEVVGWYYFYWYDEQGYMFVVVSDFSCCLVIDCGFEVCFYDQGGVNEEDGIYCWVCVCEMMLVSVVLSLFNFKDLCLVWCDVFMLNQQGCVLYVELYEYVGVYGFCNVDVGYEMVIVVGFFGLDSIYMDEYGWVCVQFYWDWIGSNDDCSLVWIWVVGLWVGVEFGSVVIFWVGLEVVVYWLFGDFDWLIIFVVVVNCWNMLFWILFEQWVFFGLCSCELVLGMGNVLGGCGNYLIFDDMIEQLQVQLKFDY